MQVKNLFLPIASVCRRLAAVTWLVVLLGLLAGTVFNGADARPLANGPMQALDKAQAYMNAGLYQEALTELRQFDSQTQSDSLLLNNTLAEIFLKVGQPQKALRQFLISLEESPDDRQAVAGSAQANINLGDLGAARKMISRMNSPEDAALKAYLLALCDDLSGSRVAAESRLKAQISSQPKSDQPVVNYARFMVRQGRLDEASTYLLKSIKDFPKSGPLRDAVSEILMAKGQKDSAIEHKKAAIELYHHAGDEIGAMAARISLAKATGQQPPDARDTEAENPSRQDKASVSPVLPPPAQRHHQATNRGQTPAPEIGPSDMPSSLNAFPFPAGTNILGGSGFVVDNGKKVVTNRHVVEKSTEIMVRNGLGSMSKARVIHKSDTDDLAILELISPFPADQSISFSAATSARTGSDVVVMGYPLWFILGTNTPSITNGVVARNTGLNEDPSFFQVTAKINRGNSGGPVFDMHGNLVGITQGKLDAEAIKRKSGYVPEDVNFAIHIDRVIRLFGTAGVTKTAARSAAMRPDEIYQNMLGKVVMVAAAVQ